MINVGVIGCGDVSSPYLRNLTGRYARSLRLAAVCDSRPERAARAAAEYGAVAAPGMQALLRDGSIDLVINLTPPAEHAAVIRAALQAGKHVYSEAPLAPDLAGVAELQQLAADKGLLLCCGPDTFLGPTWQTARKMLDDGWVGKPLFAYANSLNAGEAMWHPDPAFYYTEAGALLDAGMYHITALVALLGPVDSLFCYAQSQPPCVPPGKAPITPQGATHYVAALTFKNGVIVNMTQSRDTWLSMMPSFEVHGEHGSLYLPDPMFYYAQDDGDVVNTFTPSRIMREERMLGAIEGIEGFAANEIFLGADIFARAEALVVPYHTSTQPLQGWGAAEMAHVLEKGGRCRASGNFVAHCHEVRLAFDISARTEAVYHTTTTCRRPAPMPMAVPIGEFE